LICNSFICDVRYVLAIFMLKEKQLSACSHMCVCAY